MKKLLFIAITFVLIACKEEPMVDYAILTGKIMNKEQGDITINSFDRTLQKPLVILEDGTFTDTLKTDINSYVLFDGKNPIFLHIEAGYHLNVTYDSNDLENSLSISGKGSEVNTYLFKKRVNENELFGMPNETFSLNEIDFIEKIKALKKSQDALLMDSKEIPNTFLDKERRNLQYAYLNKLNDYENAHRYFTKNEDFKVSENFLNELNDFDYSNETDFNFSNDYKNLVTRHYKSQGDILAEKDSLENDIAYLKTVSTIKNARIKNGLLFEFANYNMTYSKDLKTFYAIYSLQSTNEKNNTVIAEKYKKLIALEKGQPSPKFVAYENFKGGTTSLDDLKGKYIYIDVWATWCGPCIVEIPSLKKVEKQFHDKNIEFVSISIDRVNDHEKWKTMIKDKELTGMQLFADNDWSSDFVKGYEIQGIPRFILIDPNGNIVDANALRPSNPELVELFETLKI